MGYVAAFAAGLIFGAVGIVVVALCLEKKGTNEKVK